MADWGSLYDLARRSTGEDFNGPDKSAVAVRAANTDEPAGGIEDGDRCIAAGSDACWSVERDRQAGGEAGQLVVGEDDAWHSRDGRRERKEMCPSRCRVGIEWDSLFGHERADAGSTEGGDVAAAAEALAQVAGEGANVRSLAAGDFHTERRVHEGENVDSVDADSARREVGRPAPARKVVRPPAGELGGGVCGRNLLDRTEKRGEGGFDGGAVRHAHPRPLLQDWCERAFGVVRRGAGAERDLGDIGLGHVLNEFGQSRCPADAEHENAGGQGIEGAGMAELRAAREPAQCRVHGGARGDAVRFVEYEQAVGHGGGHNGSYRTYTSYTTNMTNGPCTTRACVIYNPAAGRGRTRRLIRRLGRAAGRFDFRPTDGPRGGSAAAAAAIADGYTTVIAAGGDGTVHEVANGILRAGRPDVVFGVWPAGSANDYAYALNVDSDWPLSPDWKKRLTVMQVDVGRVTGGGRERFFVNGLGVGFNASVTLEAHGIKRLRGMALYGVAFVRAVWRHFHSPRLVVTLDGTPRELETLALTISLGKREGGFLVTPNAELADGQFDYVHAGRLGRFEALRMLPRIATGTLPADHPLIRQGRCASVRVRGESPLRVHTDGEFFCLTEDNVREIAVELLPGVLRVLCGRRPCN
jgi:diacylglycerol kinase (ATP)